MESSTLGKKLEVVRAVAWFTSQLAVKHSELWKSVDALGRDGADAQYIRYFLSKSCIILPKLR